MRRTAFVALLGSLLTIASAAGQDAAPSYGEAQSLRERATYWGETEFAVAGAEADAVQSGRDIARQLASGGDAPANVEGLGEVLGHLLSVAEAREDGVLRAEALVARAVFARSAGDGESAAADLLDALASAKKAGSSRHADLALGWLATLAAQGAEIAGLGDELEAAIAALPSEVPPGPSYEPFVSSAHRLGSGAAGVGRLDAAFAAAEKLLRVTTGRDGSWAAESLLRQIASAGREDEAVLGRLVGMLTTSLGGAETADMRLGLLRTLADVAPERVAELGLLDEMDALVGPDASPEQRVRAGVTGVRLATVAGDKQRAITHFERAAAAAMTLEDQDARLSALSELGEALARAGAGMQAAPVRDWAEALPEDAHAERALLRLTCAALDGRMLQEARERADREGGPEAESAVDAARETLEGDLAAAERELERAAAEGAWAARGWLALGEAYREIHDPFRVLTTVTRADEAAGTGDPDWPRQRSASLRMWAQHHLGNDGAAAEAAGPLLDVARADVRSEPWMAVEVATYLDLAGRHDEAAELMRTALARFGETGMDADSLAYHAARTALCLLGAGREADADAVLASIGGQNWWPSTVARLLRSGIAARAGDAASASALLADVGADAVLEPGLTEMLGLDGVNTPGEFGRVALLMSSAIAGLDAAGADGRARAAARLVHAEALNSLGLRQEALTALAEAEGLLGQAEPVGELRSRLLRAQAASYDGLGDAAKAAELRQEAERALGHEAPVDAAENPGGDEGPQDPENPFG